MADVYVIISLIAGKNSVVQSVCYYWLLKINYILTKWVVFFIISSSVVVGISFYFDDRYLHYTKTALTFWTV